MTYRAKVRGSVDFVFRIAHAQSGKKGCFFYLPVENGRSEGVRESTLRIKGTNSSTHSAMTPRFRVRMRVRERGWLENGVQHSGE